MDALVWETKILFNTFYSVLFACLILRTRSQKISNACNVDKTLIGTNHVNFSLMLLWITTTLRGYKCLYKVMKKIFGLLKKARGGVSFLYALNKTEV